MRRVVSELEILDFAEGMTLDPDAEESLISLVSASPDFRSDLEKYRRDLAMVDYGIPQIPLTLDIARELPGLARAELQRKYKKLYAPIRFFRSRELLIVVGFIFLMLALVVAYLWLWARKN